MRSLLLLSATLLAMLPSTLLAADENAHDLPNILWITSEDNGPELGCYGDDYADSPNIDSIAAKGMRYKRAWSNAPVCAPARTTIISGIYPPALGAEHMRSQTVLPDGFHMFPYYLHEAGYYCTNNSKEDYNLAKEGFVWDQSNGKAHWRGRKDGQPFFAVFNFTTSHESQLRKRPHTAVHDPAGVRVPAYHPDTPEVRRDWAQYYDKITEMDRQVGRVLAQLKEDGLEENTIVFYYGDHGSGMPRSKRWPYDSGLHVPMIVHVPEKYKKLAPKEYEVGGESERLVSFVDLAPTVLSLAGIEPKDWMQGHAFMGEYETTPPKYMFGFRGRMDERYDMVRTVTDGQFVYIRNYMPHKIYGQHIDYMFQTPTTKVWKQMYDNGKLNEAQSHFWEEKPSEELYELASDPDEVRNLADDPKFAGKRKELGTAVLEWQREIRDIGFLPEEEIHSRRGKSAPYELGHNASLYDLDAIMETALLASARESKSLPKIIEQLQADDSAVRYWAALGLLMQKEAAVDQARKQLRAALNDKSPNVRCIVAEALGCYGNEEDVKLALETLGNLADPTENGVYVSMLALNSIDAMDEKAKPLAAVLAKLPDGAKQAPPRTGGYVPRLLQDLNKELN
ncbi:sulfatase-like hydrolase/transferase [Bremerella sp. T1]|uniref:sulfatase-like hydrolase/transferase n=1 Tax=Bremerella sp. TYQ1 TaxID=3119568 RepID=UPI001CCF5EB1|nr:sulfatase-like hydrolase/transferase [Bremerella volcania]UBM36477.1 sulfatase-like hydrolase/transferase [Bremerella volcania]